jgi:hypothetical protein
MSPRRIPIRAGLAVVAAVALIVVTGAPAQAGTAPHIAGHPRSVMVNGTTQLTGKGFPANTAVRLQECGTTAWILPEEPCDTTNHITVMTGPTGRFTTAFTLQLCPRVLPPKPPVNRERCYIGEPQVTGEDTAGLLGAAKIIVSYP